jgi:hypothetical protein
MKSEQSEAKDLPASVTGRAQQVSLSSVPPVNRVSRQRRSGSSIRKDKGPIIQGCRAYSGDRGVSQTASLQRECSDAPVGLSK